MLVSLKKRLAPTDEARNLELIEKYRRLQRFDNSMDIEEWLKDWEITYADALALNIPEVSDSRPQNDFAVALNAIDEAYATSQQFWLRQASKASSTCMPSLYDIIEDFRNNYRRNQALRTNLRSGAFSTSSEKKDGLCKDTEKTVKPAKPCLCGQNHQYKHFYYITPSERPQNWKGKQEIF